MSNAFWPSRRAAALLAVAASVGLAACGGSSSVTGALLSGTISGLTADGLVLTSGGSNLAVAANSTAFTFTGRLTLGGTYAVSVKTQPTGLVCRVANATGTAVGDITNIAVTCAPAHSVGGSVTGLVASGLVLANGSDNVSVPANSTSFVFPAKVGEGSSYGVTVLTQPAGQTCTVANGASFVGQSDVTSVQVSCI
ncbi:hypothetical protein SAMN06265795_107120 [Noviherbaspirillum humi]|uniref:Uncharacterized protein n=1 Tax=Noviherbaspirillum humi TaxID=1688639 RepID=A0A239HQX3_9BURK|nr:hypothetical protein [Noviherbaspirillum humi]SNS83680.1 hypothetical protein SAMN06265795_107120 [Noviherbaspirillum humi]